MSTESIRYYDIERGRGPATYMETSTTSRSFKVESWSYIQHEDYQLQLLRKNETQSTRPRVPATTGEILSFYRSYCTTTCKTHMVCLAHLDFQSFLWFYLYNIIFKSVPTAYYNFFLSVYASEQHLCASKMVPICYGFNWCVLISAFFELLRTSSTIVFFIEYSLRGTIFVPWYNCEKNIRSRIKCVTINEFKNLIAEGNITVLNSYYQSQNGTHFNIAPCEYFRRVLSGSSITSKRYNNIYTIYFIIIWVVAALNCGQLFKKTIWKIHHIVQLMIVSMILMMAGHMLWVYTDSDVQEVPLNHTKWQRMLAQTDFEMLASTINSPPVVHFFASRMREQVLPGRDTAIMLFSNGAFFLFRGVFTYRLKKFCESLFGIPINFNAYNAFPWFYTMPIYASQLTFGDVCVPIFFILNLILEWLTFIITYQCLVEVTVCEWPILRRWMVMIVMTIAAIICHAFLKKAMQLALYYYSNGITTLFEIIIVVYLYPLGRLVDDILFHSGHSPPTLMYYGLLMSPVLFFMKYYTTTKKLITVVTQWKLILLHTDWKTAWIFMIFVIVFGAIYAIARYVFWEKRGWGSLFQPSPTWGPIDHVQRQMRKQFDSREYVQSTAPRLLGRYMIAKTEAQIYRVDIYYHRGGKRSTVVDSNLSKNVREISTQKF